MISISLASYSHEKQQKATLQATKQYKPEQKRCDLLCQHRAGSPSYRYFEHAAVGMAGEWWLRPDVEGLGRKAQRCHPCVAELVRPEHFLSLDEGKAEAQRLLQASLTSTILQQQAIDKWDGSFPTVMGGEGTLPFININPNNLKNSNQTPQPQAPNPQ